MQLLKNYQQDLLQSRKIPLLIELSNKDLTEFGKNGLDLSLFSAQKIYDIPINDDGSNFILIDGDRVKESEEIFIFEELLILLKPQIKEIKNLIIIKKAITKVISIATAGIVDSVLGSVLDNGLEVILDHIHGTVYDIIIDTTIDYIDIPEKIIDEIDERTSGTINDSFIEFFDALGKDKVYLTPNAKQQLEELSKNFKKELSAAESFSFIIQLILSMAIEMPKVIFVNNPHKLDKNSLAILSLLYSYSKDLKDEGKHCGVSVVYAYSDKVFQPYEEVNEKYKEKKRLLDEQRLYVQRYAMLERPTSDIPHIAVKSHMFVGRKEELKSLDERYFDSKKNKTIATLTSISGEPGIGKTKLIKKHLQNIRKKERHGIKMIQLSLLNQVGHTSSNTGLSSLIDSIVKEATRLENTKVFTEVIVDKVIAFSKNSITNYIKNALGVNKLIEISEVLENRIFIEARIEQTLDNSRGDKDHKSSNQKQQQFTALTISIRELRDKLSDDSIPIVLFIDDLQWIDEDSAEYILKHFIKQFNVHIVVSVRPSDATTMLSKIYTFKEQYPYSIALLTKVKINIYQDKGKTEKIDIVSNIHTSDIDLHTIYLQGLNTKTLTSLISQVIRGDKEYQTILAKNIIKKLNNNENIDEVNTLFAVETINMLSDTRLYSTQTEKIEQLIITDPVLRFNEDITDFQMALEQTFRLLDKKYRKAFEHVKWDKESSQQKFSLMAYAVMEERLNILKVYFVDHGTAAINTLLFSSLLGSPFNTTVIKRLLQTLTTTDEELLKPLKEKILAESKEIILTETQYIILEEVYEILSRYSEFNSSYEYRHSLLNIFLDKQLEYYLEVLFEENLKDSKEKLFSIILEHIIFELDTLKDLKKEDILYTDQEYIHYLYHSKHIQKIIEKLYKNNPSNWENQYIDILLINSIAYSKNNNLIYSIELCEEALNITTELYESNKENYLDKYVTIREHLANLYTKRMNFNKALSLRTNNMNIIQEDQISTNILSINTYIASLLSLAESYIINNDFEEASKLQERALEKIKSTLEDDQKFSKLYMTSLSNLAGTYSKINRLDEAIVLYETFVNIYKELEVDEKDLQMYYNTTIQGSHLYYEKKDFVHAIDILENIIEDLREFSNKNIQIWADSYSLLLNNLAQSYFSIGNDKKAIELQQTNLKMIKKLYISNNQIWVNQYSLSLNNLALLYKKDNLKKSISLQEENNIILENIYKNNNFFFAEKYAVALNNLALLYNKDKNYTQELVLQQKNYAIRKSLYIEYGEHWAKFYGIATAGIALAYYDTNNFKKSLYYYEKLHKINIKYYGVEHLYTQNSFKDITNVKNKIKNENVIAKKSKTLNRAINWIVYLIILFYWLWSNQ